MLASAQHRRWTRSCLLTSSISRTASTDDVVLHSSSELPTVAVRSNLRSSDSHVSQRCRIVHGIYVKHGPAFTLQRCDWRIVASLAHGRWTGTCLRACRGRFASRDRIPWLAHASVHIQQYHQCHMLLHLDVYDIARPSSTPDSSVHCERSMQCLRLDTDCRAGTARAVQSLTTHGMTPLRLRARQGGVPKRRESLGGWHPASCSLSICPSPDPQEAVNQLTWQIRV